jgi:hypothetical protein
MDHRIFLLDPIVLLLILAAGIVLFQIAQILVEIEDCDDDIE